MRAAMLAALALWVTAATADDTRREFWPEVDAYVGLDERSRLMFSAAGTRAMEGHVDHDSILSLQQAQFSVNFDYTLAPILRRDVPRSEWSKNRLLWARLGFEYGTSLGSGDDFRSTTGIVELNTRLAVHGGAWLTNRLRADLREINGESSQRYRVRVGAEWAATAFDHPYEPYASVEALYDTRYDKWSRTTLKAGLETPIGGDWRVEPYLELRLNRPDDQLSRVLGLGLTFKVYFD
jgi:hypothetical protein